MRERIEKIKNFFLSATPEQQFKMAEDLDAKMAEDGAPDFLEEMLAEHQVKFEKLKAAYWGKGNENVRNQEIRDRK